MISPLHPTGVDGLNTANKKDFALERIINNTMENENTPERIIYTNIDQETLQLLEVALNCVHTLADAQVQEDGRNDLLTIADELGLRFGMAVVELEETSDLDADGEVIYKPKGGLFNDEEQDDEPTASDSVN